MSTNTPTHNLLHSLSLHKFLEKGNHDVITTDTASISTSSTLCADPPPFQPAKSLHIHKKGMPILSVPFQNTELEVSITNDDGTPAYTSTRQRWNSANSILKDGTGRQRLATSYFFGPGREPLLSILGKGTQSLQIRSGARWMSRTRVFVLPDGRRLEWRYRREKGVKGEGEGEGGRRRGRTLVLMEEGKVLAMLVRNEKTRKMLGSRKWSAGCGGELVLGPEIGVKGGMSEDVVVASCLVMLKKELDRRRALQALVVVAAVAAEA